MLATPLEVFMDEETLIDIRRMCEIVLNNTFGNSELDSLALYVGHHPLILNPDNAKQLLQPNLQIKQRSQ